jgi:hypothetical protein
VATATLIVHRKSFSSMTCNIIIMEIANDAYDIKKLTYILNQHYNAKFNLRLNIIYDTYNDYLYATYENPKIHRL